VLIELEGGETEGIFTKSPVFQRAILAKPAKTHRHGTVVFSGLSGHRKNSIRGGQAA